MGSCISKCKPKKTCKKNEIQKNQEECKCQCIEKNNDHAKTITPLIQDKLVISQAPVTSPPPSKSPPKTSLSSAYSSCTDTNYPTTSSSSSSSTCMSTNTSLCSLPSSASSLASSSSIQSSKLEQSFSNDFLWSCVKDNPQILNEDYHYHHSIKGANPRRNSLPMKSQTNTKKVNKSKEFTTAPSPQRGVHKSSAPQKRPRCNTSPSNLTRQKSFRREAAEAEPPVRPVSRSGRDSRPMSPSSSRRFNGEGGNQARNVTSSSLRRDHNNNCNVKPQSPNKSYNTSSNNSRKYGKSNNLLAKRENENNVIKEVSAKIEELGMGGLVSNNQDVDMVPIEDINNPHIALDCFIFL